MAKPAAPAPTALPRPTRLVADPSLRLRSGGRLLIGGSPTRFIKISQRGAALVSSWLDGAPVKTSPAVTKLVRRLIAARMVHPVRSDEWAGGEITVVIPVKDDQDGLLATLAELGTLPVIVVDDGSVVPIDVPPRESGGPFQLIRRDMPGGPGVARETGRSEVSTPLTAFVDAGVELDVGALDELSRWFADPDIVAVGPRVTVTPRDDRLTDYEVAHSPLDLGTQPANVGPGGPVSYLPTACLVTRTATVDAVGGFDPGLRYGEDVDLVWRLLDCGDVRYDPSIVVRHPARATIGAFARQRRDYASAAAPLAARYGTDVAPIRMSGWSLAIWGLIVAGHPLLGLGVGAGTAVALEKKLKPLLPDAGVEAVLFTARGHWYAGRALGDAAVRSYWPLTMAAFGLGLRRSVLTLMALAWLPRLVGRRGPVARRMASLALSVLDDGAYGAGVWRGAWRERSGRALAPDLANWPGREA